MQNSQFRAVTVTRGHNGATRCSDWLNRSSRRHTATRGPRPHDRSFVTPRPGHSRHVPGPAHTAALTAEAVVIDYETFARIRDCRDRQGLTITQIARTLGVHRKTVAKWLARSRFERPRPPPRTSILDPFKGRITRLLDTHPYSAQQIFQRLREEGYSGGITILREAVREGGSLGFHNRPPRS